MLQFNKNARVIYRATSILILALLLIITITGVSSFDTSHSREFVNQYGDTVQMWGSGIYAHDSYFKAPIFIGSDLTMLLLVAPWAAISIRKSLKEPTLENYIATYGIVSLILYYAASLAFGVTYNALHLAYIALFTSSLLVSFMLLAKLHAVSVLNGKVCTFNFTRGLKTFLIIAGVSLFVAWLPDIILSLVSGNSLALIEVYTTENTYVLDMGIISPLIFLTYYLVKREDFIGYVLLRMLLKACLIIGIMLPVQTVFQLFAGIHIPVPALITKVFIFSLMALFAAYFEVHLKRETRYL